MAKKELTLEEKQRLYDQGMEKLNKKHAKQLEGLEKKRVRITARLEKKYADDPEKLEQELGVLDIDNGVWRDLYDSILADHAKTLEIKYLK
ncbi:MAG: hypothetical protein IJ735_04985 [Clostridia bacterium]|nr:hypothetical protein [Clostridia bacterium]